MRHESVDYLVQTMHTDKKSFEKIFQLEWHRMFCFTRGIIHDKEEAEDIVSGVFERTWKKAKENPFICRPELEAFLHACCRNACYNFNAKKKRDKKREAIILTMQQDQDWENAEIESNVITRIQEQVEKLPPHAKEVFKLAYYEGYQNKDISFLTGLAYKTVRNLKAICIKQIKLELFNHVSA